MKIFPSTALCAFEGTEDDQVARQRLEQHWFITEYIAAYIQGLYTVYKGARVQGAVANWSDR
jgi:hypothetical protein